MIKTKKKSAKSLTKSFAKFDWSSSSNAKRQQGFTLPEVIVAFSVLVMVITAATQILVTVLRVNADNVSSLVAYGLAQEGMEAVRFVRDSDTVLGLQFDGATKAKSDESVWGEKLFDAAAPAVKFFTLEVKNAADLKAGCKKTGDFTFDCLPIQLMNLDASAGVDALKTDAKTLVYKKIDIATPGLVYFQNDTVAGEPLTYVATQFHRFIRVESLKTAAEIDKLRVSSVVSWTGNNGQPMQVVLTSELTNWK